MKKIPWVASEEGLTPAQIEKQRWEILQQAKAKKRMKHDRGLPEDCHGCNVGTIWTEQEVIDLVKGCVALTKGRKVTTLFIADLCRLTNRTRHGVLGKLSEVGLLRYNALDGIGRQYETNFGIHNKRCETVLKKYPAVLDVLKESGWRVGIGKSLVAPVWWELTKLNYSGIGPKLELNWDD